MKKERSMGVCMSILTILRRRPLLIHSILIGIILYLLFFHHNESFSHVNDEHTREIMNSAENDSFCSPRSVQRGYNQYVLSVAAYESTDRISLKTSVTWSYIQTFATQAKLLYPKWIVRVYYYNLISKTKDDIKELERLYPNLDFCNGEDLPVLGNLKNKLPGKMQRFLPAIDPFVGVTMVRDLDSDLFEREVNAVNEWLSKSTYAFHTMRDHQQHGIPMLGGLWGVASNRLSIGDRFRIARALLKPMNDKSREEFWKKYSNAGDQIFLEDHVWPIARRNSMSHDSFSCYWSRYIYGTDTRPFPTRRKTPNCFVGCAKPCCTEVDQTKKDVSSFEQCPSRCRPSDHQDWLFC